MIPDGNQEFLAEFKHESQEHLDASEACLLRLTNNPADEEAVQACFRALHTVKGGAGFMSLDRIQGLAHAAEQLLDAVRENRVKADHAVCDALLTAVSRLRELTGALDGDAAPEGDDADLRERLKALLTTQKEDTDSYRPAPAPPRQEATARRVKAAADTISMDLLLGELLALDPAENAAIRGCLDRLQDCSQQHAWPRPATDALARMQRLLGTLADPATRSVAHDDLLEQSGQLMTAVAAADVRTTSAAVVAADGAATAVPDLPSVSDFCSEADELQAQAEAVQLASATPDAAQIQDLFRSFHTVKGMAAYLGHPRIEQFAHAVESRLSPVRDGTEAFTAALHAQSLAGIDGLRALLSDLRNHGVDRGAWPAPAAAAASSLGLVLTIPQIAEEELPPNVPRLGDLLVQTGKVTRQTIEDTVKVLKPGERLGDKLIETGKVPGAMVEQAAAKQQDLAAKAQADGFARVSIARLEELVNLVGELLITQAQVAQDEDIVRLPRAAAVVGRQARVVRSLQSLALGLRLVPLRATFQKMARAVHDTARRLDKRIDLELIGEDVEVDRTMVEAIADPLLHMVRNAADHGIESAAIRTAAGKPAAGSVRLSAEHSGDHVIVQLRDDGKGLDPAKLIAKAKEKGLIAADAQLSPQEAFQLIFLAGFSTAEQVTGISGRGVGMDVVRRNLERVKGRIDIDSTVGKGSSFTIRLPLTTAILDAMTLRVGSERFLVPITAVIEAIRPEPGQVQEILGRGRVIKARGRLVPVVALGPLFGIAGTDPAQGVLLVLDREAGPIALQVDELLGLQQVVVKPLESDRPHHPGISAAAILGDGRVGLIIDPKLIITD